VNEIEQIGTKMTETRARFC